jgi:hypothetical protein
MAVEPRYIKVATLLRALLETAKHSDVGAEALDEIAKKLVLDFNNAQTSLRGTLILTEQYIRESRKNTK